MEYESCIVSDSIAMLFVFSIQSNMVNALAVRAFGFGLGAFFFLPMCVLNNCIDRIFESSATRNCSSNFLYLCLKCLMLAAREINVCMGSFTRRKAENRNFQMTPQGVLVKNWHFILLLQQSKIIEKKLY